MTENTCKTCKHSGNLLGRHVVAWCNKFRIEQPDSNFGCNHHEPKPKSKRERVEAMMNNYLTLEHGAGVGRYIPGLVDRIFKICEVEE